MDMVSAIGVFLYAAAAKKKWEIVASTVKTADERQRRHG
jgi:hypothetical protein